MGASNRTLLSKLGFADADRKSPRHDLACSYIAQRDVLKRAIQAALPKQYSVDEASAAPEYLVSKGEGKYSTTVGFTDLWATFIASRPVTIREPVTPPEALHTDRVNEEVEAALRAHPVFGKTWPRQPAATEVNDYREFAVQVRAERERVRQQEWESLLSDYYAKTKAAPKTTASLRLECFCVLEIKIAPCSSGDLIRQLRVYNEHLPYRSDRELPSVKPEPWSLYAKSNRIDWSDREWSHYFDAIEEAKRAARAELHRATIAVLDFDIDNEYQGALRACGITPIRLGPGFDEFLSRRSQNPEPAEVPSI